MLDKRPCNVGNAAQLDAEIRDIFALDLAQRGGEICGTLNVYYSDESARQATLIPRLEVRGVRVIWHKTE